MDQTAKKIPNRALDAEALMKELRREIEEGAATAHVAQFFPFKPKRGTSSAISASEDLLELNIAYPTLFLSQPEFTSHRRFIGPIIVAIKRLTIGPLWKFFIIPCLVRERQFFGNLLKFLNFTAQNVDHKVGEIFWDLIRKIDVDIQGVNERLDRSAAELDGTVRAIERNLSGRIGSTDHHLTILDGKLNGAMRQLNQLDDVARGLERTLNLLTKSADPSSSPGYAQKEVARLDTQYLLLENRFRGSEESIKGSLSDYIPFFVGSSLPILDIGCGRGEMLELFREENIPARGIDIDRAMVLRCQEKGLDVVHEDLFAYLEACPGKSLGGVIATQVVEHLTQQELKRMLELIQRAVTPGGKVVLETINPQSVTALARNFFRDPTHVFPVHPETLRFSLEMLGFKTREILYRSPYPESAKLQPVAYEPELPARWIGVLQQMNDNVTRLNELLFGHQDYAIVSEVE